VTEMQRLILRYVKSLQDILNMDSVEGSAPGPELAQNNRSAPGTGSATGTEFRLDEGRFPEVRSSFIPRKCTKKELEMAMREYLGHHYRMCICQW
jgi:hypothetical protein